jgi:16S rRNA (guanine527-N7)-methyltransferase
MRDDLMAAVRRHQGEFGLELTEAQINKLADYFELVEEHNPLLHLVAPCSPEEFAVRHILESLTLLEYLPEGARFADVGTGAGLPSIPCLLVREDLSAVLIESKVKKTGFLQKVLAKCEIGGRAELINRQFSEIQRPDVSYVTCRALDKFVQNLPRLLKWSGDCTLLFFGGPSLRDEMARRNVRFTEKLMPLSEQRFLFVGEPGRRRN